MSQAKVEQRKKEKANRKQIMKKEKLEKIIFMILGIFLLLAICIWIAYSVYAHANPSVSAGESTPITVNTDAVSDYLNE